jgi:hypothetical protein
VRMFRPALLSATMLGSTLFGLTGVSCMTGCGGKPADGTMVIGAAPLSEAQKAMHRKFYDRSAKRGANAKRRGSRR